ncbi:hypothetical protein YC2023_115741 [Brassica napus]
MPPIEAILAPLEAELKLARSELPYLMLRGLLDVPWQKAVMIDDVKNRYQELMKQKETCQVL